MASGSELVGDLEESVERAQWEPRHEWESRVKFVEDNVARYGLEKAIQLSIVWGNMKFLGCKYPAKTESLVAYYPLPSADELRERRKRRPPKLDRADGPPDPKKPTRQEVSELISSIRSQAEHDSVSMGLVESIGRKICLCGKCIGKSDNVALRAQQVLEKHTALCREPVEISFKESASGDVCTLVYKGEVVVEKTGTDKKNAKTAVCAELMKSVVEWQESNQLPPCQHTILDSPYPPKQTPSQQQYPPQQNSSYSTGGYQQPAYPNYPPQSHDPRGYSSQSHDPRGYSSQSHDQGRNYAQQSHNYPSQSHDYQRNFAPQTNRYPTPRGGGTTNSYPPPNSYQSQGDQSQYRQGGNYFMPPRPRGGGFRGGYNRGGY